MNSLFEKIPSHFGMLTVEARYHGPTETKGTRISYREVGGEGRTVFLGRDEVCGYDVSVRGAYLIGFRQALHQISNYHWSEPSVWAVGWKKDGALFVMVDIPAWNINELEYKYRKGSTDLDPVFENNFLFVRGRA